MLNAIPSIAVYVGSAALSIIYYLQISDHRQPQLQCGVNMESVHVETELA